MAKRGPKPDKTKDDLVRFLKEEKGKTFSQIGSTLGISKVMAWKRYQRSVNELSPGQLQDVNE